MHLPAQAPVLATGEAHFWIVQPSALDSSLLAEEDLIAWKKLNDFDHRKLFAASRGGTKMLIGIYNKDALTGSILRQPRGKPFFPNGPEFSISHTAGRVFIVLSLQEVGLDVESLDRHPLSASVCQKYFSPPELDALDAAEDRARQALRLWVCKEAIVKLSGDGIAHGLRLAHVTLGPDGTSSAVYDRRPVHLCEFSPVPGLLAVVASWQRLDVKCFCPS